MSEFETGYQALGAFDEEAEAPPSDNIVIVVPDSSKARWNHIVDLDEFFTRVYHYHQRNGFLCMVLQDSLQLLQFMFVVLFTTFLVQCVDYNVLFDEVHRNQSQHKVTLNEAIQCHDNFSGILVVCLIVAALFWLFRFIKVLYNLFKYLEMRAFYTQALKITSHDLINMTWHEVQRRLLEVQTEQQMCVHKQELTELDIYHRILRFKNYMVAMVNKALLPLKYKVPCYGDYVFLTTGLKYNLEMILFWGPWSPFENNWHLKTDFKNYHKRQELAAYLSRRILWVGIGNLLLSPLIFLWQILYSFFRYAEVLKREPGTLGSRMWSLNARLYLRHFNELDHEFNARLNRGYRPAEKYMNIFISPVLVIVCKHVAFFAGAVLAVLVILTVIDEDILAVQHVIGLMTGLGVIITVCRACIPDEHMVWCPELLMRTILAQIHYIPDNWQGNAHKTCVRDEFAQLFQYKVVYLLEELFSPIITPLILCFALRNKSLQIVDFFRNFTVEVTGVGDVCSFAQMDIRRHGNAQWIADPHIETNTSQQAEDGKTELSLMHFTLTNPEWRPPETESIFLSTIKEQAHRDASCMSLMPSDNPLLSSLHSLSSAGYCGFNSMISSLVPGTSQLNSGGSGQQTGDWMAQGTTTQSGATNTSRSSRGVTSAGTPPETSLQFMPGYPSSGVKMTSTCRGGIRNTEGPLGGSTNGILASLQQPGTIGATNMPSLQLSVADKRHRNFDEEQLEMMSAEMSFSALYLHELHRRRMFQPLFDIVNDPESPDKTMEEMTQGSGPWSSHGSGPSTSLPHIQESEEEEEHDASEPLLDAKSSKRS